MPDYSYISDHALIRFMERVEGIDIDAIRDRMHTETLRGAVLSGATKVTVQGVVFYCKNQRIVTTWNQDRDGRMHSMANKGAPKRQPNRKRKGGSRRSKKATNSGFKR